LLNYLERLHVPKHTVIQFTFLSLIQVSAIVGLHLFTVFKDLVETHFRQVVHVKGKDCPVDTLQQGIGLGHEFKT